MKNRLYATVAAVLVVGVPVLSAVAAQGPRPSSSDNWPGMTEGAVPANTASGYAVEPPRAAAYATWRGMTDNTAPSPSPFDGPRPSSAH